MDKLVSIVIRTKNEEELIAEVLKNIKIQKYKNYEVILVDSGSTDATVDIANSYGCKIITMRAEDFTFGYAINYGFEHSEGEYLCLISGHAPPYNEFWLENFVKVLDSNDEIVGCYGGVKPLPDANLYAAKDSFNYSLNMESDSDGTKTFSNANSIVKRVMWDRLRFDEQLSASEDRDWAEKTVSQGFRVKYVKDAIVYHSHNETCKEIHHRSYINAKAAVNIDNKVISRKRILKGYFSDVFHDYKFAIENNFSNYLFDLVYSPIYRFCQHYGLYKGYYKK